MDSRWNEADARGEVRRYGALGVGEDLALRTYSARLLGADRDLVLHGGGNTSVKTSAVDLFGDVVDVLCVKGSGSDLARIEPAGHPAVRLAPLLRLRGLARLTDEEMVNAQRQALLDSAAPNPSVETLLHAFLPGKFIDHTHAVAVLAIADQPDAEALVAELYGDALVCVPYIQPGFDLAQGAAAAFDKHPEAIGMVLINHGVFSFGATARQSYERMIEIVSIAESHIAGRRPKSRPRQDLNGSAAETLPAIRGALAAAAGAAWPSHWILDQRCGEDVRELVARPDLHELARRGVATPDHVIRTKASPLVLAPLAGHAPYWRRELEESLQTYMSDYQSYFARNAARHPGGKTPLDPLPRLILSPDLGLIGLGRNAREAAVAADIGESWVHTLLAAEALGRFAPVGEADAFDMEYWSLEQAKLGKSARRSLEGRVVAVTGGAGAIGRATVTAFAAHGAQVAILDLDGEGADAVAATLDGQALALRCDVTDKDSVEGSVAAICARFGGLDVMVSNAGLAIGGDLADLGEPDLRRSLEINFIAHHLVARAAVRVFKAQAMGGVLLFNASKQALNPGPGFGAYGAAKAALLALMRQYALEHGRDGVRVNAINPDRIRSGLLTEAMITERAAARGVDPQTYLSGNLLGEEVTAEDVAQAFVFAALMRRTTGAVLTVDGGNVAAMVR